MRKRGVVDAVALCLRRSTSLTIEKSMDGGSTTAGCATFSFFFARITPGSLTGHPSTTKAKKDTEDWLLELEPNYRGVCL